MAQTTTTAILLVVAAMLMASTVVSGLAPSPSMGGLDCVKSLAVCSSALKDQGKPSKNCCEGLEVALKTQLPCLCKIFTDKQLLAQANLTTEMALQFPLLCNLPADPNMCSPSPAPQASSPHIAPAPSKDKKSGATQLMGTGFVGLILISIAVMFH